MNESNDSLLHSHIEHLLVWQNPIKTQTDWSMQTQMDTKRDKSALAGQPDCWPIAFKVLHKNILFQMYGFIYFWFHLILFVIIHVLALNVVYTSSSAAATWNSSVWRKVFVCKHTQSTNRKYPNILYGSKNSPFRPGIYWKACGRTSVI